MFEPVMMKFLGIGIGETLYMTLLSTFLAYVIGLPLGIVMVVTDKSGIRPRLLLNKVLDVIINILRSVPFLILMIVLIPFTRAIAGTTIGPKAAVVSLVVAAAPFIARLVESSIKEVDYGVIEAAQSMGASPLDIVYKVLLPEAKPFDCRQRHCCNNDSQLLCYGRYHRRRRTRRHCHQLRILSLRGRHYAGYGGSVGGHCADFSGNGYATRQKI